MDTNENIDWKIPNGIPVMILMVIKYNTVGICKSSRIFLMLKTLAGCSLLSERKRSNYAVMLIKSFLNLFYMPPFKGGSFDSTLVSESWSINNIQIQPSLKAELTFFFSHTSQGHNTLPRPGLEPGSSNSEPSALATRLGRKSNFFGLMGYYYYFV